MEVVKRVVTKDAGAVEGEQAAAHHGLYRYESSSLPSTAWMFIVHACRGSVGSKVLLQ